MARRKTKWLDPETTAAIRELMERKKAVLDGMRTAYFNRTPFAGKNPNEEDVRNAAEDFIRSNYEYQRAVYGRVRVKLSSSNLLR